MNHRRFLAPTMQLALKQIREELGPDAAILSSRKTPEGVEVVCETTPPAPVPPMAPVRPPERPSAAPTAAVRAASNEPAMTASRPVPPPARAATAARPSTVSAPVTPPTLPVDPAVQEMRQEIAELRALIRSLPKTSVEPAPAATARGGGERSPSAREGRSEVDAARFQDGLDRLQSMGFSAEARQWLLAQPEARTSWAALLDVLKRSLPVDGGERILQGGVHVLVGPTGAGKTSTLAKLAARHVLQHGADTLALVTTDQFRLAGTQPLYSLGRLLKVPVLAIGRGETLDDVLDRLGDRRLVLVDTAGLSPSDAGWAEQQRQLQTRRHTIRRYLVLPTTSQVQVLTASFRAHQGEGLAGCILTKLDEACSLGEALSIALTRRLPLHYVTDGQNLASHLQPAEASALVSRLLKLWQDNQSDKHYTSERSGREHDLVV